MIAPDTTLIPQHRQQLHDSAISDAVIAERGYRSIAPGAREAIKKLAGGAFSDALLRVVLHEGALALPVYRLGRAEPSTWALRPDLPRTDSSGKPVKYEWPKGVPNVLDALPRYREALADPRLPLCLIEGIKKADALASAYGDRLVPVALNGVFGWRGRNDKGGKVALEDFEHIAWEGRTVWLAPDGDVRFNPLVLQAVQRLATLLVGRHRVAEVLVLLLPNPADGPKVGADDYLAAGHSTAELEAHLTQLAAVTAATRIPMGTHPDTGAKLFLPEHYTVVAKTICRSDADGKPAPVYPGAILVREVGIDLGSGDHRAVVAWNGRGDVHGEVTVPYAALSDTRAFSQLVGNAGAAIGPKNMRDTMQFLVDFAQENIDAIPRRLHADRLGLHGDGLVLPAGAVGIRDAVRYTGRPAIAIGSDADIYKQTIRQVLRWGGASLFWLVLGLGLVAPALARLRLRRNPVFYMSGASGSGKTTTILFTVGAYGDPTRQPFLIQGVRSTPAGIFQTLEGLGGLPAFVDEAHMTLDPAKLESACYAFANGQRYTVGGADGKARGGTALDGTLFLAGEAIIEFKHAGSRLRVLWADVETWPPLGAETQSSEGLARATILERAWLAGAGLFGKAVAERIWQNWPAFVADVKAMETDRALAQLQGWRQPLAAAAAALNVALHVAEVTTADLPDPGAWIGQLLDDWTTMLLSGHSENDPASEAWENLLTLLAQGRRCDNSETNRDGQQQVPPSWEWIEADHGGGLIACRQAGDGFWRVLTATPQFKARVHAHAAQLYGQTWLKRGWILPGRDGKSTDIQRVYQGESVRILRVPVQALATWDQKGETGATT